MPMRDERFGRGTPPDGQLLLPVRLLAAAHQGRPEQFAMFGFSRSAVLGCPDPELPDDLVLQIANGQGRQRRVLMLSMLRVTA